MRCALNPALHKRRSSAGVRDSRTLQPGLAACRKIRVWRGDSCLAVAREQLETDPEPLCLTQARNGPIR